MKIDIPYGKNFVNIEIPDKSRIVYPEKLSGVSNVRAEIRKALNNPIGCLPIRQLATGKTDAIIVINDITRPIPTKVMLEELLKDLAKAGIEGDDVKVVIALGNHRPNTKEEIMQMVGKELYNRLNIYNHDCEDDSHLTFMGVTKGGLPIWVNSLFAKASLKILTGLITPHQSAGYSGGRKSIIPGIAGLETLRLHHSFPIRPYEPAFGWLQGNPFHEEALNGARIVGTDFILNVVKNSDGEIIKAVAGDLLLAHERGVNFCKESWIVKLNKKYDIAIVSPGGYPRDFDLHQSQKAISPVENILQEQGIIVLLAECIDGIGKFGELLKNAESPKQMIKRFRNEGFTPDHSSKAFMYARALDKFKVILSCSGIEQKEVEQMFFQYAADSQTAINMSLRLKGPDANIIVLPYAIDTIPIVEEIK